MLAYVITGVMLFIPTGVWGLYYSIINKATCCSAKQVINTTGGLLHFGKEPLQNFVAFEGHDGETRLKLEEVNRLYAFVTCSLEVPLPTA